MRDPATTLIPPAADPAIPPAFEHLLHVGDLASAGHWTLVALEAMGAPDLPREVGEWFAGDWSEVARAGDALASLGEFCTVAAGGLREELTVLDDTWDGPAGAAAHHWFGDLAEELTTQAGAFRDIAGQYRRTAFGVHRLALAAGGLVQLLLDLAIAAGLSLAAAAASAWTGVGAAVAGSAAAASIAQGARTAHRILDVQSKVWHACEALLGLVAGSLSALDGFRTVALPGGDDHPGAP